MNLKKISVLLLAALMIISLSACGGSNNAPPTTQTEAPATTTTAASDTTAAAETAAADSDADAASETTAAAETAAGTTAAAAAADSAASNASSATPTGITLDPVNFSIAVGNTAPISVIFTPEEASGADVTFKSTNTSVATVDNSGVITAVGEGSAMISVASAADSSVTAVCSVTSYQGEDPFGKFDPPITITMIGANSDGDGVSPDNAPDNNYYTNGYAQDLGINVQFLYIPTRATQQAKWQMTMASGELPDIMSINDSDYQTLLKANALTDLTNAYNTYSSPDVKIAMESDGGYTMNLMKQDGKLMTLTRYAAATSDWGSFYWARSDWMENLNLSAPKTMQDLIDIMYAFTNDDPDQNGQNDTFGLSIPKELFICSVDFSYSPLDGFFNGYHAYPTIWMEDPSTGKLVFGGVQESNKAPLLQLQQMYKDGVINPEFGSNDMNMQIADTTNGKDGMIGCLYYWPQWSAQQVLQANPNANWTAYAIPSIDNTPASCMCPPQNLTNGGHFCVSGSAPANAAEAMIKMMNYSYLKLYRTPTQYMEAKTAEFMVPIQVENAMAELDDYAKISEAWKTKDTAELNGAQLTYYAGIADYLATGDVTKWQFYALYTEDPFGSPGGIQQVLSYYQPNNLLIFDQNTGPATDGEVKYKLTLRAQMIEVYTNIIKGADISTFDDFTTSWYANGGAQITDEINDYYSMTR